MRVKCIDYTEAAISRKKKAFLNLEEIKMNDNEIEKKIHRKGLTAPRVTPEQVEGVIDGETYHLFNDTLLTVCCLTLRNGFTVTGESACASPANYDAELGRKIARSNAKDKIWVLEGYLLKEELSVRVQSRGEEHEHLEIDDPIIVTGADGVARRRHFAGVDSDGNPQAYLGGGTSWTAERKRSWDKCEKAHIETH